MQCQAKPTEMNDLDCGYENENFYSFGFSSLQAWIRCFACLLDISYKLEIKCCNVRTKEQKIQHSAAKQKIQTEFREKMGLMVDFIEQEAETSNDVYTARRFFQNPTQTAEITGLDENLIRRFAVILQLIASGLQINTEKFEKYTKSTAKLFVELYGWYNMPAKVHKILIHGSEIIKNALVPIGQLSEEAQKAMNKNLRSIRQYNTTETSRINTNEKLLHNLLVSSDPLISSMRPRQTKSKEPLFEEAKELLEISDEFDYKLLDNESD